MRVHPWLILSVVVLAGCGRIQTQTPQEHSAAKPAISKPASASASAFFVDLLKAHSEKNIVTTAEGVGLKDNATRIKASLYGSDRKGGGVVIETEFRVRLPSGKEIVDYVAGVGDTEAKAMNDSLVNFTLTTFHPIYKIFMNPADPHQKVEQIKLSDGQVRNMAMGDILMRGGKRQAAFDFNTMRPKIKAAVAKLPLSEGPHWIKIVYGQAKSEPVTVSATLDNEGQEDLTSAIKGLGWPRQDEFYMAKQFIVIQ